MERLVRVAAEGKVEESAVISGKIDFIDNELFGSIPRAMEGAEENAEE